MQPRARAPAPGKTTRTSKLAATRAPASPSPSPPKRAPAQDPAYEERAQLTDQWLDTAIRPDLYPPPVQRKPAARASAAPVQRKLTQDEQDPNLYYDDFLMQNVVICDRIPRKDASALLVIENQTYFIKWVYDEDTDVHTPYQSYLTALGSLDELPEEAPDSPEQDEAFLQHCRQGLRAINEKQLETAVMHLQKAIVIYQSYTGEPLLHTVQQAEHSDGNVRKALFAGLSSQNKTYTKAGNILLENLFRSDDAIAQELQTLTFDVREEVLPEPNEQDEQDQHDEQQSKKPKKKKKEFRVVTKTFTQTEIGEIIDILHKFRAGLSPQFLPDYLLEQLRGAREALARKESRGNSLALLNDPELVNLYTALAQEKFVKERTPEEVAQVIESLDPKQQQQFIHAKTALLVYLRDTTIAKKLKSDVPKSIEEILATYLGEKSGEIQTIFDDHPELAEDAARGTRKGAINPLLMEFAQGKTVHSITDLNDYVGDKLSDPLMHWIVGKGIPVEIHATSSLASFGRLKTEGYIQITEIPSLHRGTKKYIAYSPETKQAKVVVQSLPGESYTIQTSGAFLLYELYAYDQSLAEAVEVDSETFTPPNYAVKRVLEYDGKQATYIAMAPGATPRAVIVGCVEQPCAIDEQGRIVLDQHYDAKIGIQVTGAKVERMAPQNLSIIEEDVDYQRIYLDTLNGHGIQRADIAVIGNTAALHSALGKQQIQPTLQLETPYMSAAVYHVQGSKGTKTILSFPISPYFFGDKSGYLANALTTLGVGNIIFGGTAGGLDQGAAKGDVLVAEEFVDMTTGIPKKIEGIRNQAGKIAAKYEGTNVKLAKLHVGVHSAIVESMEMIAIMQEAGISGVDCEASFIAQALAKTAVNLYHMVGVSDVPGTQESIGMGGSARVNQRVEQEKIEQIAIIMDVLGELLGEDIHQADSDIPADITIDKLRDTSFTLKLGNHPVELNFQLVYPQITKGDQTTERTRINNQFARELVQVMGDSGLKLSDLKQTSNKQQREKIARLQTAIMNLSLAFRQVHKIKVWLTNMVLPERID